ncbi:hypothetical protein V492_06770 [Pseudogymnoascus sp. VKM F-4246]|nr:hypothetical protein V492_06770 [Pseudogymnoascus sp. VKM F-4246]
MYFSSAALLLLVPATRAAAIPSPDNVLGANDALANTVVNTVLEGTHIEEPAKTKRYEGDALFGLLPLPPPSEFVETVTQGAGNVVADVTPTKRDEEADKLANSIRKLSYEQIGAVVKLLKAISGSDSAASKRDNVIGEVVGAITDGTAEAVAPLIDEALNQDELDEFSSQLALAVQRLVLDGKAKRDDANVVGDILSTTRKQNTISAGVPIPNLEDLPELEVGN